MGHTDPPEWERFRQELEALNSVFAAKKLIAMSLRDGVLGRQYYCNLASFLRAFTVPDGSSYAEKLLYLQFIQRLDGARSLRPGARQRIEESLRQAMQAHGEVSIDDTPAKGQNP